MTYKYYVFETAQRIKDILWYLPSFVPVKDEIDILSDTFIYFLRFLKWIHSHVANGKVQVPVSTFTN